MDRSTCDGIAAHSLRQYFGVGDSLLLSTVLVLIMLVRSVVAGTRSVNIRGLSSASVSSGVPKEVDTLIVGGSLPLVLPPVLYRVLTGGIIGVATAYQLSRIAGPSHRVLLLEQNTLTSGTTWHAAGLQTALKGVK